MTARDIGANIGSISRRSRAVGSRKKEKLSRGEKRRLGQLIVCGAIFVSIVAARLLLPGKMTQITSSIRNVLGQSMNIQEVFSAVGKAVSGEASVSETLGDVYQAVFQPQDGTAVETAAQLQQPWPERDALMHLKSAAAGRESGLPEETAGGPAAAENTGNPADGKPAEGTGETSSGAPNAQSQASQLSAVSLVYSNLPKNVCLEQQILGFSYTTPVEGAVLSSNFGYREHPVEGEEKFHYGLDLAADEGTEIDCFADGTVSAVGESSSLGKYVIVEHGNGYSTLYAHCSKVTVSSAASVSKGQKVAEVGQTGLATGPHCHFELHRDSNYLNPVYYVSLA